MTPTELNISAIIVVMVGAIFFALHDLDPFMAYSALVMGAAVFILDWLDRKKRKD